MDSFIKWECKYGNENNCLNIYAKIVPGKPPFYKCYAQSTTVLLKAIE